MTETNPAINKNIFAAKQREIYWQLKEIGLEDQECQAEAMLILEHVSGIKRTQQIISKINEFASQWQQEITRIINLRRERRPLAYCLGEIEFASLTYKIIPGVLIPRTDTETLIEAVVEWAEEFSTLLPLHIADIGVGSGIIAISLLKRLPNCTVWACDISQAAITTTLGNARRHGVHERLTLVHGDWRKVLPNNFDLIISNPPYIPMSFSNSPNKKKENSETIKTNAKDEIKMPTNKLLEPEIYFEPKEALFAGEDGLDFYRDFAHILPGHYKKSDPNKKEINLLGAFEIGDEQEEQVLSIFKNNGWQKLASKKDINGLPRIITGSPPHS